MQSKAHGAKLSLMLARCHQHKRWREFSTRGAATWLHINQPWSSLTIQPSQLDKLGRGGGRGWRRGETQVYIVANISRASVHQCLFYTEVRHLTEECNPAPDTILLCSYLRRRTLWVWVCVWRGGGCIRNYSDFTISQISLKVGLQ